MNLKQEEENILINIQHIRSYNFLFRAINKLKRSITNKQKIEQLSKREYFYNNQIINNDTKDKWKKTLKERLRL